MKNQKGFTLIEMIVAVALFAVVMLVSVGALLALVGANRKARSLQSVMNNLNIALDGMVRSVRMGSEYHCGVGSVNLPQDCASGGTLLAFKPFCTESCDPVNRTVYVFGTGDLSCGRGRICKSVDSGRTYYAITAPEVTIDSMKFSVVGTDSGSTDFVQPKVVITVKGTAGARMKKTTTSFTIQATAVQRELDLYRDRSEVSLDALLRSPL